MAITPNFTSDVTIGYVPLTVSFTDTSTGDPAVDWYWEFGDGGEAYEQNPVYVYTVPGVYTVTLYVYDADLNSYIETKTDYITARVRPIIADFSSTATSGLAPLSVDFIDTSTGPAERDVWSWNFGDGHTSTLQNPTHVYDTPGAYTVTLVARSSEWMYEDTKTVTYYIAVRTPTESETSLPSIDGISGLCIDSTGRYAFVCSDKIYAYDCLDKTNPVLLGAGFSRYTTLMALSWVGCGNLQLFEIGGVTYLFSYEMEYTTGSPAIIPISINVWRIVYGPVFSATIVWNYNTTTNSFGELVGPSPTGITTRSLSFCIDSVNKLLFINKQEYISTWPVNPSTNCSKTILVYNISNPEAITSITSCSSSTSFSNTSPANTTDCVPGKIRVSTNPDYIYILFNIIDRVNSTLNLSCAKYRISTNTIEYLDAIFYGANVGYPTSPLAKNVFDLSDDVLIVRRDNGVDLYSISESSFSPTFSPTYKASITGDYLQSSALVYSNGFLWLTGSNINNIIFKYDISDPEFPVLINVYSVTENLVIELVQHNPIFFKTGIGDGGGATLGIFESSAVTRNVYSWGRNELGEIGDNSLSDRSAPVQIARSTSYSTLAKGNFNLHSLAINASDGAIWAWGNNSVGQLGNNASGVGTEQSSPISIARPGSYSAIATGYLHSLAIDASDGSVWAWGSNFYGQLGDDSKTNRNSPVSIKRPGSYKAIAAGAEHSLAIDASDGSVWTWGRNSSGQLGDDTDIDQSSPVSIVRPGSYKEVATGYNYSLAIDASDGMIWAWGSGGQGQLGHNDLTTYSSPISIARVGSYSSVIAGSGHALAIDASDGSVWAWGENSLGQLGNNTHVSQSSPISIARPGSYIAIATGYVHSLAIDASDGSVWAWGSNFYGQLGDDSVTDQSSPISVAKLGSYTQISTGFFTSYALGELSPGPSIVANFSSTTLIGRAPLIVYFTDKSTGAPDSWLWDFGDGKISTEQNPIHKYRKEGIYTLIFTATLGSSSNSITRTVIVRPSLFSVGGGTIILNSDLYCEGEVICDSMGTIIPIANKNVNPVFSCPTQKNIPSNGNSPSVTSINKSIDISGLIDGGGRGFEANFGPGCNSILLNNHGIPVSFYGATHAGIGSAKDVPEEIFIYYEYFTINSLQYDEKSVTLSHCPVDPAQVIMNIVHGTPQEYYTDFYVTGNILTWRTPPLESLIAVGDTIRVIYLGYVGGKIPLPPKPIYGSYEAPTSLGSGSGEAHGGSGIRLTAPTGSVKVDGLIDMDGENGDTSNSGGGAGGSVWISSRGIIGSGIITAEGGDASYQYAGGGGGGYITMDYDSSTSFNGSLSVLSHKGGTKGVIFIDKIEPFFTEKFTGDILNTKWWENLQSPAILHNRIQMDTSSGNTQIPLLQSKFGLSGENILADIDFSCAGTEPTSYSCYFQLYKDENNWVGITRKYNNIFGSYEVNGFPSQTGTPYPYIPTRFRIDKKDSTFNFQFVDSSAGPQTILSEVISEFEKSKFIIRAGTGREISDASRRMEWFRLTSTDISNEYVTLSSMPADTTNIALNVLHGSAQYYGVDFTSIGQSVSWESLGLSGYLQDGDYITIQYIPIIIDQDMQISWDNFRVYDGILHDTETKEPVVYVDPNYGSDSSDGLQLTPLQNLFVATAWAKKGGTVVLYDGTYNPTEVLGKDLMIIGAYGASPLITTTNVQDTTGSNWENSCLTFRDCQGLVRNIRMANAKDAVYAENTHGLEIIDCEIYDATTGIRLEQYSLNPKILRNTIHDASQAIILNTQVYDPYVYSNVIYDTSNAVVSIDSTNLIVSSNTIDIVTTGIVLDNTSTASVVSNNITGTTLQHVINGIMLLNDSSVVIYNNNFGTFTDNTSVGNTVLDSSGNIAVNPLYVGSPDYRLQTSSPDRNAGIGTFDQYYIDRENKPRWSDSSYSIGAYEVIEGSHGIGEYHVAGSGDDYRNFGTLASPYRTLDKAMSVADTTINIDTSGHYDSYYLRLVGQNIYLVTDGSGIGANYTLNSHYSNINLGSMVFVSPNGSDSTIFGGDGTHSGGNGTRQLPYRTINRALQDASVGTSIVVLSGEYEMFNGRDDRIIYPYSDRTSVPDGRWYLQSLFETALTDYPNHTITPDPVWNTYAVSKSESYIKEGYLSLVYDGTHACGADSTFSFTPQFTVQADIRQAYDSIFFRVNNRDNTATIQYCNGDWTSTVYTGAKTYNCWGHLNVPAYEEYTFFTDYICLSSEDIINKYVSGTYLIEDATNVTLNIIGGTPQELGTDFYIEDGKIKWDGMDLDGELYAGTILRAIYKARGLSDPARFQINLSDSGVISVKGVDNKRWVSLMKRNLLSDTTSTPWSCSFYMNTPIGDHMEKFGRGYVSRYYALAQTITGSDSAVPYTTKTLRQPIIMFNDATGNP